MTFLIYREKLHSHGRVASEVQLNTQTDKIGKKIGNEQRWKEEIHKRQLERQKGKNIDNEQS